MGQEKWLGKPYYSLDAYMKYTYGQKVYKIAVDAGLTCPNRDGTLDERGCIFCSAGGSGDFAVPVTWEHRGQRSDDGGLRNAARPVSVTENPRRMQVADVQDSREVYHREYDMLRTCGNGERRLLNVRRQIERGMAKFHKKVGERFVIYFQAYTNTYGDPAYLERIWREALDEPSVAGISIATRPDCLGEFGVVGRAHGNFDASSEDAGCGRHMVIAVLERLQKEYAERGKFIWVELGLQTIHEKTAEYIRRGYPLSVYDDAVRMLSAGGILYITHLILGLPQETEQDMLETVRYVCCRESDRPFGVKLQLLHVLYGTDLYEDYAAGKFSMLSEKAYIDLVIRCLEEIPPEIVIHRITGDGPKKILAAPEWSGNKRHVLNLLHQRMKIEKREQGRRVK